jgi:hypothetical protein
MSPAPTERSWLTDRAAIGAELGARSPDRRQRTARMIVWTIVAFGERAAAADVPPPPAAA